MEYLFVCLLTHLTVLIYIRPWRIYTRSKVDIIFVCVYFTACHLLVQLRTSFKESDDYYVIMWIWMTIILLCSAPYTSVRAKILGVLMTESKSHYSNLRNVADELASRGHEVCEFTYCHSAWTIDNLNGKASSWCKHSTCSRCIVILLSHLGLENIW